MEPAAGKGKWYHGVAPVLVSLFIVLGPFGLPLLWKSPRFTQQWKWILTALTLLYTVFLIGVTGSAVLEVLRLLNQQSF